MFEPLGEKKNEKRRCVSVVLLTTRRYTLIELKLEHVLVSFERLRYAKHIETAVHIIILGVLLSKILVCATLEPNHTHNGGARTQ